MEPQVAQRLSRFVDMGWSLKTPPDLASWRRRLYALLISVGEETLLQVLRGYETKYDHLPSEWDKAQENQISFLEGQVLLYSGDNLAQGSDPRLQAIVNSVPAFDTRNVFLVHGHDEAAKESVARFLERLKLDVTILHEQANEGLTVIEKFEQHSKVGFAVVLLTPDDVGASASDSNKLLPRARQNVVLELGYFTGKLGRRRVCGLFRSGLDVPSDFHGVLLTELDAKGGWRTKLAQELVSAGMQIDLQGLLQA